MATVLISVAALRSRLMDRTGKNPRPSRSMRPRPGGQAAAKDRHRGLMRRVAESFSPGHGALIEAIGLLSAI